MQPKRTPASWRSRPRKRNTDGPPPIRGGPFAEFGGGGFMLLILYTREKGFARKAARMQRIKALAAMAACACLCAALFGCAAKEPTAQEANQDRQAAVQPTPDAKEPERIEAPLREGKGEITVLVLNASGKGGRHAKLPRKSRRSASSTLRLATRRIIRGIGFRTITRSIERRWTKSRRCSIRFRPTIPIATKMRRAAAGVWITTSSSWWADRQLRTTPSASLMNASAMASGDSRVPPSGQQSSTL